MVEGGQDHLLLDVRARVQFAICAVDGAVNIPLAELEVRVTTFPAASLLSSSASASLAARKSAEPGCLTLRRASPLDAAVYPSGIA